MSYPTHILPLLVVSASVSASVLASVSALVSVGLVLGQRKLAE